jgi:hypothetical protein
MSKPSTVPVSTHSPGASVGMRHPDRLVMVPGGQRSTRIAAINRC